MKTKLMFGKKRKFDVKSKEDVAIFKKFLETLSWGKTTCPFELEFPYLTVPDMIKDKLVHYYLDAQKAE